MKEKWIRIALIALFALSSCLDKEVYQGEKDDEKEYNEFDFSTVQSATDLEVSYLNCGVEASVYFEIYDEMPVIEGEYSYTKKPNVTPLFAAFTADDGVFTANVVLPSYLKKVYIYTPAFFAKTLIVADVTNGVIKAVDEDASETKTRAIAGTTKSYNTYMITSLKDTPNEYKDTRWKTWLGTFDQHRNGEISYKYTGALAATSKSLYAAHSQVINIDNPCPEELRSYTDMNINEAAEIAVTFLGQNTCWNCSMGYYYYKDGEKPASLDKANIIMLFPNTQDGRWTVRPNDAKPTAGIDRGTAVKLKYYPNIAIDSKEGETDVFPAGYKVGLVIANNAWSNRIVGFNGNKRYRSATSKWLSINDNGDVYDTPRTAAYGYGDFVMVSFEDYTSDQNFSDVVVALKSNPVGAIEVGPEVDPDKNHTTVETLKGIYAFEDLWPSKGDYDMNDVMVRYIYGKTFDKDNNIFSESFMFKTFQNMAGNNNGLAFKLKRAASPSSITCFIRKKGEDTFSETNFTYETDDQVYILTGNVKEDIEAEYKVTLTYDTPAKKASEALPFIFKNETNGKRWEVHIPKEAPTSKMEMSYFKQGDDASKPEQGIYYVRNGNYPFAFFLSGANENDLSKILEASNEKKAIDELYSGYNDWVKSNGQTNKDWYKQ